MTPIEAAARAMRNLKRRVSRARKFPENTCPASRHLQMIADVLASKRPSGNIEDCWEPEHMATTMYAVLESLWKDRARLAEIEQLEKA